MNNQEFIKTAQFEKLARINEALVELTNAIDAISQDDITTSPLDVLSGVNTQNRKRTRRLFKMIRMSDFVNQGDIK